MKPNKFLTSTLFTLALFLGNSIEASSVEPSRNQVFSSVAEITYGLSISSRETIFSLSDHTAGDANFFLPGGFVPQSALIIELPGYAGLSIFNGNYAIKIFLLHATVHLSGINLFGNTQSSLLPAPMQILLLLFLYHFFW